MYYTCCVPEIDLKKLQITNRLIVSEAQARGWAVDIVDYRTGLISYTPPGKKPLLFKGVKGPFTKATDVFIADDKLIANIYAKKTGLDTPETLLFQNELEAEEFINKYAPIVVKPLDSAHGRGVSVGIKDVAELQSALKRARHFSADIILQQQVTGEDLRLLFIGGEFRAAAIRKAAEVTGDGVRSLEQLIELENNSGRRAPDYLLPLNLIDEEASKLFLGKTIKNIPKKNETITVVGTANIGTGGYAIDITDEIEQSLVDGARRLTQSLEIMICGIDFLWDSESQKAYFIELNSGPSFGLHTFPAVGKPRPLAKIFLDWVETEYAERLDKNIMSS